MGVHVSIAGGLPRAVQRAAELGCDCFQIFVANPRGWAPRRLAEAEAEAFRAAREAAGLGPVVVHLSYLPNPASADPALWQKSLAAIQNQVADAARLGAEFFVLHPGSDRAPEREAALERVAQTLRRVFEETPEGPCLLLENTAGGGGLIGSGPDELAAIDARVACPERMGVCFDTAHALAAGHAIHAPGGMRRMRAAFRRAFGRHPIRLLHLNDLRSEPGSGHDRHEHIGRGALGPSGIGHILHTPGLRRVPAILETPIDEQGDDRRNLAAARAIGR